MIKHFEVEKLFGKYSFSLPFRPDLNVITGKNGSGKTTLLKLVWYMLSSNLERAVPEVNFRFAQLVTDTFEVTLTKQASKGGKAIVTWKTTGPKKKVVAPLNSFGSPACKVEIANQAIVNVSGSSIFFPTFRRIEGGFSIPESRPPRPDEYSTPEYPLAEVIREYADRITVQKHRFIASLSTNDVEDLLTRQYARCLRQNKCTSQAVVTLYFAICSSI